MGKNGYHDRQMEELMEDARGILAGRGRKATPDEVTLATAEYLAGMIKSLKNGGATKKQMAQDWGLKGLGGGGVLMVIREIMQTVTN
jgi:hypothetical protein